MINSLPLSQVPLLAELRYFELPHEQWPRRLIRARQLGANTIVAPVQAAGAGLHEFVALCGQLGLSVVLDLGPAAKSDAESTEQWLAACLAPLLPQQIPHGPIAGLLSSNSAWLDRWLHEAGWAITLDALAAFQRGPAPLPAASYTNRLADLGKTAAGPANQRAPALLRADASARPQFWRAKTAWMLLGAAGADLAAARAPADLALICESDTPAISKLADQLAGAGITFDQLALADATAEAMQPYKLVIASSQAASSPLANGRFGACATLAVLGDPVAELPQARPLASTIDADQISELIETGGGFARYAWADSSAIEIAIRYGEHFTYLFLANRNDAAYNGLLAYRAPNGAVLHLHIGVGPSKTGIVMLQEDEVVGAAFDGDGAEGGWLARGLQSSMLFNAGAGGIARCGDGLLLTAPQSGRFQLRRGAGWPKLAAYRLLLNGELLPARHQIDTTHLSLPYTAEDDAGQTDMYLVLPNGCALPAELQSYLATLLRARAAELTCTDRLLRAAEANSWGDIARACAGAAEQLTGNAEQINSMEQYAAAWQSAEQQIAPAVLAIEQLLAEASGQLDAPALASLERVHALLAHAG